MKNNKLKSFDEFVNEQKTNEAFGHVGMKKIQNEYKDIKAGLGWVTFDYVVNFSGQFLTKLETKMLLDKLAKNNMLYKEEGVNEENPDKEPAAKWRIKPDEVVLENRAEETYNLLFEGKRDRAKIEKYIKRSGNKIVFENPKTGHITIEFEKFPTAFICNTFTKNKTDEKLLKTVGFSGDDETITFDVDEGFEKIEYLLDFDGVEIPLPF